MIVAIEGLPCSYKTSVTTELGLRYKEDVITIPEFVIDISFQITPELCVVNDIAKSNLANYFNEENKLIILDRSYLSTIAYEGIASKERYRTIKGHYDKLLDQQVLIRSDKIFFLDIDPEISVSRAKEAGRFNMQYEWFKNPQYARDIYEKVLNDEVQSNVEHLDFNALSHAEAVATMVKKVGNLL